MSKYVSKKSLESAVSERFAMSRKESAEIVDFIFQEMSEALSQHGCADIAGFGKFVIFDRKSRMGINPVTMERMEIPSSKLPKFKPSETLKKKCNPEKFEGK